MRSRPITVVKAAPARRVEDKVKPKFDTPNPFAALANLDDEIEFPRLSAASSKFGEPSISSDTEADIGAAVTNAYKRGSSLMSSSRAGGTIGGRHHATASLPLLSHFIDTSISTSRNENASFESVADLLDSFPGSESIMSIFVAGLPPISLLATKEHDRVRQDLVDHLARFAPPLRAKLIPDLSPQRMLNFAFVDFQNEEECNKAIERGNNSLFRGAPIRLEFARGDRTIVLASPGNVDLEILKQVDESGTYSDEFNKDTVRWMNLTELLADRLCKHFGDIERIQVGDAPIGDSVVHVTFGCRGEARLAYLAFSNLPLKAHLSAHWLNSPNITAASHQPRRALHPRGPHGPASGLRKLSWRYGSQSSECISSPRAYEQHDTFDSNDESNTLEQYVLDPIRVDLDDQERQEPDTGSPGRKSPHHRTLAFPNGGTKHPKETSSNTNTEPVKPTKSALRRQKKRARKVLELSQGESTLYESVDPAFTKGEAIQAHPPTDPQDGPDACSRDELQLSPGTSECHAKEDSRLGEDFEGPLTYDCDNELVPTTRPELSIQAATNVVEQVPEETQTPEEEDVEASLAHMSFTYPFCRRAPPQDEAGHGNECLPQPKSNGHLLQATHHSESSSPEVASTTAKDLPSLPLSSTLPDMGMVAAFTEPDQGIECDSENSYASFYQPKTNQVPAISIQPDARIRAAAAGTHGGITHSVTMDINSANLRAPAVEDDTSPQCTDGVPPSLMIRSASDTAYSYSFHSPPAATTATFDKATPIELRAPPPPNSPETIDGMTVTLMTGERVRSPEPTPKFVPAESLSEKEIVDQGCSIWVGGLAEVITSTTLHRLFSTCGTIRDIQIKHSLQRTSRFAFIMFESREAVDLALELDGHRMDGLCIAVRRRAMKHIWIASHPSTGLWRATTAPYTPVEPDFQPPNVMLPVPRPHGQATEIHSHVTYPPADYNYYPTTGDPSYTTHEAAPAGATIKGSYPYPPLQYQEHDVQARIQNEVEQQYSHGYALRGRQKGGKKNVYKSTKARAPIRVGKDWKDKTPTSRHVPANAEAHVLPQVPVMRWPDLQERMQGYGTHIVETGKAKTNGGHEHHARQTGYMRQDALHLKDPSIIRSSDPQAAQGYPQGHAVPTYGHPIVTSPSTGVAVNATEGDLTGSAQSIATYSSAPPHFACHPYAPGYGWPTHYYYNPYHPAYGGQVHGYPAYNADTTPSSASASGASYHTTATMMMPNALPEAEVSHASQHVANHEAMYVNAYHNPGLSVGGMSHAMQTTYSADHLQVHPSSDDTNSFPSNMQTPQRRRMPNGRPPQRTPRRTG